MEKAKAVIEYEGRKTEIDGGLIICFVIDDNGRSQDGQAQELKTKELIVGQKLPDIIYPDLISGLVISAVKKITSGEVWTGLILNYIAEELKDKSREIKNNWTEEDARKTFEEALEQFNQFQGNRQN